MSLMLARGALMRRQGQADPVAQYYGTGVGQISIDLRPEDAVLDGSGNVVSVPNRGGAGSAFNATASATGITVSGGRFQIPAGGAWLNLANPANLFGVRLFMLVLHTQPAPTTSSANFAGISDGAAAGQRVSLRRDWAGGRFQAQRWDGAATATVILPAGALPTTEALLEFELVGGKLRQFTNGVIVGETNCTFPDLLIRRIFAGQSTPYFSGTSGAVRSLIVDGSTDVSAQIAAIRASYGR